MRQEEKRTMNRIKNLSIGLASLFVLVGSAGAQFKSGSYSNLGYGNKHFAAMIDVYGYVQKIQGTAGFYTYQKGRGWVWKTMQTSDLRAFGYLRTGVKIFGKSREAARISAYRPRGRRLSAAAAGGPPLAAGRWSRCVAAARGLVVLAAGCRREPAACSGR